MRHIHHLHGTSWARAIGENDGVEVCSVLIMPPPSQMSPAPQQNVCPRARGGQPVQRTCLWRMACAPACDLLPHSYCPHLPLAVIRVVRFDFANFNIKVLKALLLSNLFFLRVPIIRYKLHLRSATESMG